MSGYDHVATIYDFAKEQGYKVSSFNTSARSNRKGRYNYVQVSFVVPEKEADTMRPLEEILEGIEKDLRKEEVKTDEV